MVDSRIDSTEIEKNVLVYLRSQQLLAGDLTLEVRSAEKSGFLSVRKGRVVGAACGNLLGNGALLSLASIREGNIQPTGSENSVQRNVSLSLQQVERIISTLGSAEKGDVSCNEEEKLAQAVSLFYQFQRKEAGARLVEILRFNRFYYPAWLWHSRLMTREEYILKALTEAKRWGNCDRAIKQEVERVEPLLTGSEKAVKRCFFCWSPVPVREERCLYCKGLLRVSKKQFDGEVKVELLEQTLLHYEQELQKHPENTRVAYCLCLGFYSLGKSERAREFISQALKLSPREPLFIKTAALLSATKDKQQKTKSPPRIAPFLSTSSSTPVPGDQKTILVVEDSKTSRKVISMLLARKGYRIIEATTGSEVFLQTENIVPDLVLLDVMLPDMTGYEVLARFKKESRFEKIPVVMLTGKKSAADRLRGIRSGSDEYLTKPFNPAKLLAVIAKYLEHTGEIAPVVVPKIKVTAVRSVPRKVIPPARPAPVAKKSGKSILVVEDSPTSRKVISMVLVRKGYVVREAVVGAEALSMLAEEGADLILLDAMLPDMTGYDILSILKKDDKLKKIPVVMLTGKKSSADREKGIRAGSVAYLTKPFDPDKLISVIHEHI